MDKQNTINFFKKNGYIILRNVYSKDQILRYRKFIKNKIQESRGLEKKNWKDLENLNFKDILSYPELRDVILNRNLLEKIKILLNDEEVYYWGYSSFRYNEKTYRSTHNDAKNDDDNPFKTFYPLLRIGVYLQDHEKFSNGLKIFKGSKHSYNYGRTLLKKALKEKDFRYLIPQTLRPVNVDTKPGDVVIWNLRTCHSANALRLKYFNKIFLNPIIENLLEKFIPKIFEPNEKEIAVIFSTFGAMGNPLKNFLRDNIQHSEIFATINNSDLDDQDLISKSKSLGLNILDVKKLNLK